ncbi:MAG: HAMP domain-containing histidine kinase [Oscillospiraceae bacterium]|nr:HAMP domain-containing histidine kinase [Oscillospiraceae bacterium]
MRSTFSRTFFSAAMVLLMAMLLIGTSFQALVKNYLTEEAMEGLKNDGNAISALASAYYTEGTLNHEDFLVNLSFVSQVSQADAVICDSTGRLALCSRAPFGCGHQGLSVSPDFLQNVFSTGCVTTTGIIQGLYEEERFVAAVPITDSLGYGVGIVIVSTPMEQVNHILQKISDTYLLVSVLVVVLAVVMMSLLARNQSKPLRAMAKAANDFGHGNLDARVQVDPKSSDEVQDLALAFNNMASSLQQSEYQRQEFVANVSHELKTPMTTISGFVDGMLDGTIPPERHKHYMHMVSDETKRLSRLVRSMLDISRLQDQDIPEEKKSRFELQELAGQVLITFEQKIDSKNLNVDVDFPGHPTYTHAVPDYITQVIYNLLDNAVKFCPEGGDLGLKIRIGTTKLYVSISNSGETIPQSELPLVFDRFHKLDKSRSQNRDGWGLGLYIVKTIVCRHGEDISVTSQNGVTTFTFTLPLVN